MTSSNVAKKSIKSISLLFVLTAAIMLLSGRLGRLWASVSAVADMPQGFARRSALACGKGLNGYFLVSGRVRN